MWEPAVTSRQLDSTSNLRTTNGIDQRRRHVSGISSRPASKGGANRPARCNCGREGQRFRGGGGGGLCPPAAGARNREPECRQTAAIPAASLTEGDQWPARSPVTTTSTTAA